MIDLHMHTQYSDGTDTIIEILKKAENKKLSYISITDHNTCNGYLELKNIDIKKYYSGNIIKGIELNTHIFGIVIELLGYGIDIEKMSKIASSKYLNTEKYLEFRKNAMYNKFKENNIEIPDDFIQNMNPDVSWITCFMIYLKELKKQGKYEAINSITDEMLEDHKVFYRQYLCDKDNIFYMDPKTMYPNLEECIDIIRT